jgi:drug/metabolite transporter (DMT)-like permease
MTHARAVALMVLATLLWAIAGPFSRHIESAHGAEVTFWRSAFAALTVGLWLLWRKGLAGLAFVWRGGKAVWISGFMWSIMFTCFMVALSLTQVANVLVMQCLAPVFTALLAAAVLKHSIARRTWMAIVVAALAVCSMYVFDIAGLDSRHTLGMLLALGIPLAAAVNWVTLQRYGGGGLDLTGAVLLGGGLSALLTLAWALPFQATWRDIAVLATLGVFQLAVPCILAMRLMLHLKAPEVALLSLLEIVFGVALTWLFGGEAPGTATLVGGSVLLLALAVHEVGGPARR